MTAQQDQAGPFLSVPPTEGEGAGINGSRLPSPPSILPYGGEVKGGAIRFWVRDNGPGLSEGDSSRLFTQFSRLHQARAQGHGLGLSIVRRIAEKLGGNAGVESEIGQGSVFYFTLQAYSNPDEANPAVADGQNAELRHGKDDG